MPLPSNPATGRNRVRGMAVAPVSVASPLYWDSAEWNRRVSVSVTNNTGVTLHDHLITATLPGTPTGPTRVTEYTITGIDRPNAWRYSAYYAPNRMPYLPHYVSGTTVTIKALGYWLNGTTRSFHIYWDRDGRQSAPSYTHLGTIDMTPLFSGLTRVGPETENFGVPLNIPAGLPLGTSTVAAVRPGFGYNNEQIVRMGRWTGNTFNGTTTAAASPTVTNRGPYVDASATLTFDRAEWAANYTCRYEHHLITGRKSDDTGPRSLPKNVDVCKVTLTWTCGTAYTPATISGATTAPSGFDILSPAHNNTGFGGNTTMVAGNKKPFWIAATSNGAVTEYTTTGLGALGASTTGGHVIGMAGNFYVMAVLPVSLTLTNFGTQAPTAYWSSDSNGWAYLGLRNLSNASQVPVGATISCTFWYIRGHTNNATTVGDVLLVDEAVDVLRGLAATLTPTVGAVERYGDDTVTDSVLAASDSLVRGIQWFVDTALSYTGRANNTAFSKQIVTGLYTDTKAMGIADEDDGSYGEAHKLHGLCLKYLRTHDPSLIRHIERQAQYHLDIEADAVAAYGSWWAGTAPFWYSVAPVGYSPTVNGEGGNGVTVDPNFNGGVLGSITYTQGQPRRATSADQLHMVSHALWAYYYLLRNEPAITANTTLRANILNFIGRAATYEETHFPVGARVYRNLHKICQGLTPLNNNGITDSFVNSADSSPLPNPYLGSGWGVWQTTNTDVIQFDPSANFAIDGFFRALYAPDTTLAGTLRWLSGHTHDFTILDPGLHESTSTQTTWGEITNRWYPKGWGGRGAAGGNDAKYNAGRSGDKHYLLIDSGGVRDQMNGRYAQRVIVTALLALISPTATIRLELDSAGATVRSIGVRDLLRWQMNTIANHLVEETTGAARWSAYGYFGGSDPKLIESAFTGYCLMALEIGMLALSGASYLDYYPIGVF